MTVTAKTVNISDLSIFGLGDLFRSYVFQVLYILVGSIVSGPLFCEDERPINQRRPELTSEELAEGPSRINVGSGPDTYHL